MPASVHPLSEGVNDEQGFMFCGTEQPLLSSTVARDSIGNCSTGPVKERVCPLNLEAHPLEQCSVCRSDDELTNKAPAANGCAPRKILYSADYLLVDDDTAVRRINNSSHNSSATEPEHPPSPPQLDDCANRTDNSVASSGDLKSTIKCSAHNLETLTLTKLLSIDENNNGSSANGCFDESAKLASCAQ